MSVEKEYQNLIKKFEILENENNQLKEVKNNYDKQNKTLKTLEKDNNDLKNLKNKTKNKK